MIIDERVIPMIEMMGYPKDYIMKCLNNNELNYATTGYYLLANKHSLSLDHSSSTLTLGKVPL